MATLASAKAKYARKTSSPQASERYRRNANGGRYQRGMSEFLGRAVASDRVSSYESGVQAAQYRGGDPDKWERNLIEAMT